MFLEIFTEAIVFLVGVLFTLLCSAVWLAPFFLLHRDAEKKRDDKAALLLKDWAMENGYSLIRQESIGLGPFLLKSSNQRVYEVVVADREGRMRHGWVLCGDWFMGMRSRYVKVSWDESAPEPTPAPTSLGENDPLWDDELDG